jgi:hypothetical protein
LNRNKVAAIVPAPLLTRTPSLEPLDAIPVLNRWVRGILVLLALALIGVFAIALWLDPRDDAGQPLWSQTHRKLGLPECQFRRMTGIPCPSCGMTTSFAWLMHGRLDYSLRANAVGTLLACFWLFLIPWSLLCAIRARPYLILSFDRAITWAVIIFVVLLLTRWGLVLAWEWLSGTPA